VKEMESELEEVFKGIAEAEGKVQETDRALEEARARAAAVEAEVAQLGDGESAEAAALRAEVASITKLLEDGERQAPHPLPPPPYCCPYPYPYCILPPPRSVRLTGCPMTWC
jgi:septal ring factor EnvC (AmiA/AmiB activator)